MAQLLHGDQSKQAGESHDEALRNNGLEGGRSIALTLFARARNAPV
jgi:hypothetical protein